MIETKLKIFDMTIMFKVSETQIEIMSFDIIDKKVRCYKCFSPTHQVSNCFTFNRGSSRGGLNALKMVIKKEQERSTKRV